jgi:hypothetical protein
MNATLKAAGPGAKNMPLNVSKGPTTDLPKTATGSNPGKTSIRGVGTAHKGQAFRDQKF